MWQCRILIFISPPAELWISLSLFISLCFYCSVYSLCTFYLSICSCKDLPINQWLITFHFFLFFFFLYLFSIDRYLPTNNLLLNHLQKNQNFIFTFLLLTLFFCTRLKPNNFFGVFLELKFKYVLLLTVTTHVFCSNFFIFHHCRALTTEQTKTFFKSFYFLSFLRNKQSYLTSQL